MLNPNYWFHYQIRYVDNAILLELLSNNSPYTLESAAADLEAWLLSNKLVLNVGKTNELIISSARDNTSCGQPSDQWLSVEQVESFKHLVTAVDAKFGFEANTQGWPGALLASAVQGAFFFQHNCLTET